VLKNLIIIKRTKKMSSDLMAQYNEYEHKRWLENFERTVDRMEPIVLKDGEKRPHYFGGVTAANFWVHIQKQPDEITETIRKTVGDAMPSGYNNVAYYLPWGAWDLKYACC
jgi:hypothetical protein